MYMLGTMLWISPGSHELNPQLLLQETKENYNKQFQLLSCSISCLLIAHTLAASLARYKKNPSSPMVLNGSECLLIDTDICNFFQTYGEKQQHSTWDGKEKKNITKL